MFYFKVLLLGILCHSPSKGCAGNLFIRTETQERIWVTHRAFNFLTIHLFLLLLLLLLQLVLVLYCWYYHCFCASANSLQIVMNTCDLLHVFKPVLFVASLWQSHTKRHKNIKSVTPPNWDTVTIATAQAPSLMWVQNLVWRLSKSEGFGWMVCVCLTWECSHSSYSFLQSPIDLHAFILPLWLSLHVLCVCALPVGLKVSKSSLQIIEQIHFLAALRTVDVQQFTVVQLSHLLRSLPCTAITNNI